MYKCNECEKVFDEPRNESETMGEYCGVPAIEYRKVCPCCGGGNFEEAVICKVCGEYYTESEIHYNDVCENCIKETLKRFNDLIENNFDEIERQILNDEVDEI